MSNDWLRCYIAGATYCCRYRRRQHRLAGRGRGLHVGPRSAGAEPGPACYGRGGSEPTVTDANVILGRLSPESIPGRRDAP